MSGGGGGMILTFTGKVRVYTNGFLPQYIYIEKEKKNRNLGEGNEILEEEKPRGI
jgi:hypothetical protein